MSNGPRSTMVLDASVEDRAQLGSLTLVMKGEQIPAASLWTGNPASPMARG